MIEPSSLLTFIFLIPLLPLLASTGIAIHVLSGRAVGDEGEVLTERLSVGSAVAVLLLLLIFDLAVFFDRVGGLIVVGNWFTSGDFTFPISFAINGTSLALATEIAFLSWVTVSFSVRYLHREDGFHRFFLSLGLFLSGMQLVTLAGNGLLVFVGWEFCGLSSYLLIGYAYLRPTATENALFSFMANRIGDAGFLMGLAIAILAINSTDWHDLATWAAESDFDKVTARLMIFGFLIAAIAKSAQLPFSPWIARALEGPTPSSAIFYGAIMVHAGVWLVIRLAPVLLHLPDTLRWLIGIGFLTALYGWFVGLVQTDVKSALIFATITQVGLMFLECGLGWFTLATWHLGLHALWRTWQFLMASSYMQLIGTGQMLSVPSYLIHRQGLWTAALQRFWLDSLGLGLLARPLLNVGHDLQIFDDRVLARIVGMPSDLSPLDDLSPLVPIGEKGTRQEPEDDRVICGHGLAGILLLWAAYHFQRFESRLILGDNVWMRHVLHEISTILLVTEDLLEQPRYLLLFIIVTLVVII